MKTKILFTLFLLSILNSMSAFKMKNKQIGFTCNYAYLKDQDQTNPSLDNRRILGTAAYFGVLAGQTTTNHGNTTVVGSLGVHPSASIAGDNITLIGGQYHAADKEALDAKNSLIYAYNYLAGQITDKDLTGTNLAGLILLPGVYGYTSSAFLTNGTLTLDANGNPDAVWIFKLFLH